MPQNVPLWTVSISRTVVAPGVPNGGTARTARGQIRLRTVSENGRAVPRRAPLLPVPGCCWSSHSWAFTMPARSVRTSKGRRSDERFGGTVLKTSLSEQDEQEPRDALHGARRRPLGRISPHRGRLSLRRRTQVRGSQLLNRYTGHGQLRRGTPVAFPPHGRVDRSHERRWRRVISSPGHHA